MLIRKILCCGRGENGSDRGKTIFVSVFIFQTQIQIQIEYSFSILLFTKNHINIIKKYESS